MWIKLSGALLAAMSMVSLADAGLLGSRLLKGAEKGCGCAATHQPACCKPVIVKPCAPNVYTYQRKCSDIKPPCCDTCAPPTCCAPAGPACAAPAAACAPACAAPAATCAPAAAPACAAPAATCAPAPAATCAPAPMAPACAAPAAVTCAPAAAPACAAPCAPAAAPACAAPCAPACAAPCAPVCTPKKGLLGGKGLLSGLFSKSKDNCGSCNTCAAPAACETRCCNADPCEIAKLIYQSQTACYAKDRRKAIHTLGDNYDCICNPEIMTAFIVGLNDADERVRRKAADEIGDQIRKNCCCSPEVVAALTCALGDCDKWVVKQAKEALELCGYEVVNGCCNTCATGCTTGTCAPGCAPSVHPTEAPAPAPVPPMTNRSNGGLQQLLGLR